MLMLLLAQAVVLICAVRADPQTNSFSLSGAGAKKNAVLQEYDVTKEVKIQGTIQKIESDGTTGLPRAHFLVKTATGVVDADLGSSIVIGTKCAGIAPGDRVTVTGIMQGSGHKNLLIARILTTANYIFLLRNERGVPARGIPRRSPPAKTTMRGGELELAAAGSISNSR
jgi:hypothetical protein